MLYYNSIRCKAFLETVSINNTRTSSNRTGNIIYCSFWSSSERGTFSQQKILHSTIRNALKEENVEAELFLKYNLRKDGSDKIENDYDDPIYFDLPWEKSNEINNEGIQELNIEISEVHDMGEKTI